MAVSYNKLWKLLVDKKMSKAELRKAIGVSPNTITKMNKDDYKVIHRYKLDGRNEKKEIGIFSSEA